MTRITALPFDDMLKSFKIDLTFGPTGHTFVPLFSPIAAFLATAIFAAILFRMPGKDLIDSSCQSLKKMLAPSIALAFAAGTVQLLLMSHNNMSGLPSIPSLIASSFGHSIGNAYLLIAPAIGAIGAFTSGSNTISNLLFAGIQYEAALRIGLPMVVVVALQTVGGAVGNMISVHNIIAASATVGLHGEEGILIRRNLIPVAAYTILAGIIGIILTLIPAW